MTTSADGIGRIHRPDQVYTSYSVIFADDDPDFEHAHECDYFGEVQALTAQHNKVAALYQFVKSGPQLDETHHFLGYVNPDGTFAAASVADIPCDRCDGTGIRPDGTFCACDVGYERVKQWIADGKPETTLTHRDTSGHPDDEPEPEPIRSYALNGAGPYCSACIMIGIMTQVSPGHEKTVWAHDAFDSYHCVACGHEIDA